MVTATTVLLFTSLYPLVQAIRSNRRTSLNHAFAWVAVAWLAWGSVLACELLQLDLFPVTASYLALVMTGCAGMAVLGARRPGMVGWNFVVVALLAVMLLPLAEGWGELRLSLLRAIFLGTTLAVAPLNYLPTRMGLAALTLAAGCGLELSTLLGHTEVGIDPIPDWVADCGRLLVVTSPWIAWGLMKGKATAVSEFNQVWLDFRDRFGLTWSLRMREQFNRAASNAGWHVRLGWSGLQGPKEEFAQPDKLQTLHALLKRFGPE